MSDQLFDILRMQGIAAHSQFYSTLQATATELVLSTLPSSSSGPATVDSARICAIRSPSFTHTFKSSFSPVQHFTTSSFLTHLQRLTPNLSTWSFDIRSLIIDCTKLTAVLSVDILFTVKGLGSKERRTVLNDTTWFIRFSEDGKMVESVVEYVDAEASKEMLNLMRLGVEAGIISPVSRLPKLVEDEFVLVDEFVG